MYYLENYRGVDLIYFINKAVSMKKFTIAQKIYSLNPLIFYISNFDNSIKYNEIKYIVTENFTKDIKTFTFVLKNFIFSNDIYKEIFNHINNKRKTEYIELMKNICNL